MWHKFGRQSAGSNMTDDTEQNRKQYGNDRHLDEVLRQHLKHAQLQVVQCSQNEHSYHQRKQTCRFNTYVQHLPFHISHKVTNIK